MERIRNVITTHLTVSTEGLQYQLRPNASNGLWLMFLLPLAVIISAYKHQMALTNTYKLLPLFSLGLLLTSIQIISSFKKGDTLKLRQHWFSLPISLVFYMFLNSSFLFSLYSGLLCTMAYNYAYSTILRNFPKSFTLGEAGLTSQALVIVLYTTLPHFFNSVGTPITKVGQSSTAIIQMELFGILVLAMFLKWFRVRNAIAVYFWTCTICVLSFLIPLHVFLQRSPLLWVLKLLIKDYSTMKMVMYWIICSCVAVLAIIKQQDSSEKASSAKRKIFHILAVLVYIPGLMYQCNLLYLGSGILLGIFFLLEIFRNLDVPPLGPILQASFAALSDEKDAGPLAATPIYLLTGFTLPLWIHPSPCDVTDSAYFQILPLLSGILSVGIGDTAASIVGTKYGKHHYPGSKKTIEGTLACIVSQLLTVFVLNKIGFIVNLDTLLLMRIIIAVVFTSVVEAITDQIDNAILPLIMYILLV